MNDTLSVLHGRFNGRRFMHFYMASRVGWEHLSNVFHLSQKFIIRFFHLVNRLVLLHLIYSSFNKFITLYSRNIFQPSEKEPSIAIQSTLKKRSYKSLYNFSINANHRFTNSLSTLRPIEQLIEIFERRDRTLSTSL